MQGQRGTIGSLPEILEFSHGSSSGNPVVNQPICWNNIPNPVGNHMPNYMLAPNSEVAYVNSLNQEQQNLSGWSLGEPNFSGSQNEVSRGVQKREDALLASASAHSGTGQRSEEWQCDPPNVLSLGSVNMNPLFLRSSNADGIPQNLNLNADFGGDDHQASEFPNLNKSSGSVREHIQLAGSSNTFLPPSGSGGYLVQENDSRPNCSLDGRRASCKRKALEGSVGQSSMDGSSNYLQLTESSLWHGGSGRYNEGTSLSISSPSEQSNPRLCARTSDTVSGSMLTGSAEGSHRNFRLRINPPNQQEPTTLTLPSTGNAVRYSSVSTPQQSSRPIPVDHSLDLRSASASNSAMPQSQSTVIGVPPMLQNVQPFGWNDSSSSRAVTSAGSFVSNDRNAVRIEDVSSRSRARNIQERPMFVPATELRGRNQTTRNLTGAHTNIPGNAGSTATAGSSSGVHRLRAPHWVPHPHPPSRNTRRLPEYVRRSLFSSIGADSGGQNNSLLHSAAPSSDERALPSGAGNDGHHRLNSRSMSWMERHGDGALGISYPLRTLASVGEGRSRLVASEQIRNVLELMRRGGNIRFEDVMLLDQSVFFGGADLHDRHRDMRLDVDNMSYEELLALEERIGNVNTGLSEEIILNRLKQRKYSTSVGTQQETEPCCVCQEEYNGGEDIGTLDCGHGFHAECIKQWLKHKNLCPICKTAGLAV
ncbi:probable E3 ubiquitin-protein ligase RHG1A isoform X1 [Tripterygium wilfordii]|uniref:probable E3 ubiquitin-protein ligase RHG1A isoform X1 n=1 Tax=Tripterygium wilfordii TaxID=458696 RepID=UPI0018F806FB|nr:probable E3 ubiquitin-protein ligase RHG1A isoform X1 [Tripterygium wilfordii]